MKAIGGYIRPGLLREVELKPHTIRLNTGRNALECVLRLPRYRVLHVLRYTCCVLREPLKNLRIEPRCYDIDPALEPLLDTSSLSDGEGLLYTNYFGSKDDTIRRLAITSPTLIMDQAQAFYAVSPAGVEAFDSARYFIRCPMGRISPSTVQSKVFLNRFLRPMAWSSSRKEGPMPAQLLDLGPTLR